MAGKSRFIISESSIKKFFLEKSKVYSEGELKEVLEHNRVLWNLPISMTTEKFIGKLIERKILTKCEVTFSGYYPNKTRYLSKNSSAFNLALSLASKAYLSHYTAAFLLGLTTQVPKIIYLTSEQSAKDRPSEINLFQNDIDSAFKKPQRKSGAIGIFEDYSILLHNGMHTNKLGVFSNHGLIHTNIERTLIDITVRPEYGGGVSRVLEIFENSIEKLSINKLKAILDKLNFIYPYHQAIGFYLEKAGLDEKKLAVFLAYEKPNNFYLTYEMKQMEFNEKWKIFYPTGI
jgi:hypothetical protein